MDSPVDVYAVESGVASTARVPSGGGEQIGRAEREAHKHRVRQQRTTPAAAIEMVHPARPTI